MFLRHTTANENVSCEQAEAATTLFSRLTALYFPRSCHVPAAHHR